MAVTALPDLKVLPAEALRALILAQHEQLLSRECAIEHLKLLLSKLHRMQFGRKSEKLARQIEQLELRLEELQSNASEKEPMPSEPASVPASWVRRQPKPRAVLGLIIFRGKRVVTIRKKRCAHNARASCGSWARMFRRCWSTCPPVSWWSGMYARS